MKKLFLFLTVLLAASNGLRAEELQPPHITVFGTATTEVVPDRMVWSVQVRIERLTLEEAASEHANSIAAVLKLLKQLKIEDKHIQTSQMEFGENVDFESGSRKKHGYFAQAAVSFKLEEFSKYQKLWIGLTQIDGVSVKGTSYDDSKCIEHRKETRKKALEAAREKAAEMAKVLGAQIQEPLEIEEDLYFNQWWDGNNNANAVQTSNATGLPDAFSGNQNELDPIALGTIPVQVRVKVTFKLAPAAK